MINQKVKNWKSFGKQMNNFFKTETNDYALKKKQKVTVNYKTHASCDLEKLFSGLLKSY